jgi:tetratricopeptide (TPR) repeat protein
MFNYYGLSPVWLAQTLSELGEFARGLTYLEETAEICEAHENWWGLAYVLHTRGLIQLRRGDYSMALPLLEEGLEVCRSRRHFPALIPSATANLGYGYALAGRPADGLPLLEHALADAERLPVIWAKALWSAWLAEAHLLSARLDDATTTCGRALGLAVQRKERGQEAYARRLLGEIRSRANHRDTAEAERQYRAAAALAQELGMRPLVAHCHLGLGKLHSATGLRPEARECLAAALAMYREMDMPFWLEHATAALKT